MKYIIAALILLTGCKSAEKLAAEKAAKEDIARKAYTKLLFDTRKALPCDTVTTYYMDTVYSVLPGDTTIINDTAYVRLPGKQITRTEVKTVVDRAEAEMLSMQLESTRYAAQLQAEENTEQDKQISELKDKTEKLKDRATKQLFCLIGCGILFAGCIFLRIKGIL